MKLKPCKICGSKNIRLHDCGYSSFNCGGGTCENGHYSGISTLGCFPTQDELAKVWNDGQKPTAEEKLKAENKKLRKQIHELKKGKK